MESNPLHLMTPELNDEVAAEVMPYLLITNSFFLGTIKLELR